MKEQLKAVRAFIQACNDVWPAPELNTCDTVLQNMISVCDKATNEELRKYLKVIYTASKMVGLGEHVMTAAHQQIDMIIAGHFMSKEYNN